MNKTEHAVQSYAAGLPMIGNPNATAIAKKYYCGSKGSIGLNDGRRRRRRRNVVPRAAVGYIQQLKKQ